MKVGILTFHRAYNYGAVLQAFALQKKLNELGVESEIIDYLSVNKIKQNKLFSYNKQKSVKSNLIKLAKDFYRKKKNASFDRFMEEEMILSENSYSTHEELMRLDELGKYDVYIVGSDQVWNFKNTGNDSAFLLEFVADNTKKCSYAASIGSAEFENEMYEKYSTEIKKFRVVSVREESAIEKFGFLKDNNAVAVVDPTLLLEKHSYETIVNPKILNKKYAFLYTIAKERNLRTFARDYCKRNGLLLVDSKKSKVFFQHTSPRDFLSFIQNAECVFTNSFHGTALSIMLEKEFFTELNTRTNLNNRSRDLMKKLELQDRDIDDDDFCIKRKINYEKVNELLSQERKNSENILQEIIMALKKQ